MPGDRREADQLELDLKRYELRRAGRVVRIEKIPMELLIFLVENRDQLISREAIVDRLWGKDVFLDTEQGINTAVRKIRQVLHDDAERPRFMQTVVGKGYRFVGPVKVLGDSKSSFNVPAAPLSVPHVETAEGLLPRGQTKWLKSRPGSGALFVLIFAVLTLTYFVFLHHPTSHVPAIHSIAVLPLKNLSGDPADEFFADGMTDELITNLAKISSLRVTSYTSVSKYKASSEPLHRSRGICRLRPSLKAL